MTHVYGAHQSATTLGVIQGRSAMNRRHSRSHRLQSASTLTQVALAVLGTMLATGCAPDSVRSVQATGFNAYIKQLPTSCKPLLIGSEDLGQQIIMSDMGNNDYNYFLDVTSKLYYNRMSQQSYRQAVVGFFGAGTYNEASFNCIFRTLPPDRPNAPVGTY
jgi:hypothetical protein